MWKKKANNFQLAKVQLHGFGFVRFFFSFNLILFIIVLLIEKCVAHFRKYNTHLVKIREPCFDNHNILEAFLSVYYCFFCLLNQRKLVN